MTTQARSITCLMILLTLLSGCVTREAAVERPASEVTTSAAPAEPIQLEDEKLAGEAPVKSGGGQETGAGSQATSDSRFGFLLTFPDWKGEFDVPAMKSAGVGWVRITWGDSAFVWGNIEEAPGVYDFSMQDEFVRETQKHGLRILPTVWPYAQWDQLACRGQECHAGVEDSFTDTLGLSRCNPCDEAAYANFIRALVERYDGDGVEDMPGLAHPVTHWEFINELTMKNVRGPVMEGAETHYRGTPEDFTRFSEITYASIKDADPGAVMVQAGLNKMNDPETHEFWEQAYAGGVEFDVGNIHFLQEGEAAGDLYAGDYAAFLHKHYPEKPFWVGEVQVGPRHARESKFDVEACKQKSPDDDAKRRECVGREGELSLKYDEEGQARDLVRNYVRAFSAGAEKIFYNIWWAGAANSQEFQIAAMVREDGSGKPVLAAFETLADKVDYFTSVEKLEEGKYKFVVDGEPVYVLWGAGAAPSELSGQLKVTSAGGVEETLDASELRLSEEPVYVEPH